MTQPASVTFDGTDLILWVPSLESIDFPGLSELTDPAVLDLSCYFADQGFNPTLSEANVPDIRQCTTEDFGDPGRVTHTIPLVYVTNPADPTQDEARTTLIRGAQGYLVERPGVDFEEPLAAGDLVSVWSVRLGMQQMIDRTQNTKWRISQMGYLRPPGHRLLVTVASS